MPVWLAPTLSAKGAARFWGAPGNTEAMLATPQDRVAGCRLAASFLRSVGGQIDSVTAVLPSSLVSVGWVTAILPLYCLPFYPGVFRPLSTALSRSLPGLEGLSVIITLGRSFCCQGKKEAGTQTHQPQREFSSRWGSCVVVYVPAQKPYSVRPSNGIFSLTYRTGVCQYRLERFLQVVQCLSSA